jgi:hypothetical protein
MAWLFTLLVVLDIALITFAAALFISSFVVKNECKFATFLFALLLLLSAPISLAVCVAYLLSR